MEYNLLHQETSPYLLQHANNLINWHPWNQDTLRKAKQENKIILINIGFFSCQWCFRMDKNVFEDQEVADYMNENFINIKIDKEERPELDLLFSKAIQIMGKEISWPINILAMPNGTAFWGCTFLEKKQWLDNLKQVLKIKNSNLERLKAYANNLIFEIELQNNIIAKYIDLGIDKKDFSIKLSNAKEKIDFENGGLKFLPKLTRPSFLSFILRYGHETNNEKWVNYFHLSLEKIAQSAMFDHISGGFSCCSTDLKWLKPEFEKMLSNNAQLISLYCEAYKNKPCQLYKDVVEKTINFLEKEFLSNENYFFSSMSPVSLNDNQQMEQAYYYLWNEETLKAILKNDFNLFAQVFNISSHMSQKNGNFALHQNKSLSTIASLNNIDIKILRDKKIYWEKVLRENRKERQKPIIDEKFILSWNALTICAYIDAFQTFEKEEYKIKAIKLTKFIIEKMWSDDGNLYRIYHSKNIKTIGNLEDYAFFIKSLIKLNEITLDSKWLDFAKKLTDYCIDHFYDERFGFFGYNSKETKKITSQLIEYKDHFIPSSNAIMAENLSIIASIYDSAFYEKISRSMIVAAYNNTDNIWDFASWQNSAMNLAYDKLEVVICGNKALENIQKLRKKYLPHIKIIGTQYKSDIPILKDKFFLNKNTFYIFKNQKRTLPITDFEELENYLTK